MASSTKDDKLNNKSTKDLATSKIKVEEKSNLKSLISMIKERLNENHESIRKIKYPKLFIKSLEELDNMIGMERFKSEIADKTKEMIQNINKGETRAGKLHSVIYSSPGTGKCFALGTEILMFDCSTKKVEDIVKGDIIMGDDGTPRNVLDLGRGRDIMYEIKNSLGEVFVCNSEHILCLMYDIDIMLRDSKTDENFELEYFNPYENQSVLKKYSYKGINKNFVNYRINLDINDIKTEFKLIEISVKDYLKLKNKNNLYLYKGKLKFLTGNNNLPEDPYYYGMKVQDVIDKKYLYSSEMNRKVMLTGILKNKGVYDKEKRCYTLNNFSEDLIFLSRSLGLKTTVEEGKLLIYFYQNSYSLFNVVEKEEDNYYGFVIDGNHRFLLSDFTVSHNTSCGIILAKIFFSLGYLKSESDVKNNNGDSNMDIETIQYLQLIIYMVILFIPLLYKLFGSLKFVYSNYPIILAVSIPIIMMIFYYIHLTKEIEKQVLMDQISEGKVDPRNIISVVSRGDFVGQYLGQTSLKTRNLLEANRGKVLFIDEAYSLYNSNGIGGDMYGDEALTEINKFMSENENSITIIFAGYEDKMKNGIFKVQPGLARRCQYHFEIDDYTSKELALIFEKQVQAEGYTVENVKDLENEIEKNIMYFKNFGGDTERLKGYVNTDKKQSTFDNAELEQDYIIRLYDIRKGIEKLKQNDITRKRKKRNNETFTVVD